MAQQTWFITGVNSGFGRVMTELLLQRGDRVAGTARKLNQLEKLKTQYGEQLWLTSLDVTDTSAIREAVDAAFKHFDRLDIVMNNAGYALIGAAEEFTDEQILHQINTNLMGPFRSCALLCRICACRVADVLSKCPVLAAKRLFRVCPLITRASGALRVFSKRLLRRWRHSVSRSPSLNLVAAVPRSLTQDAWCTVRRRLRMRVRPPDRPESSWKVEPMFPRAIQLR